MKGNVEALMRRSGRLDGSMMRRELEDSTNAALKETGGRHREEAGRKMRELKTRGRICRHLMIKTPFSAVVHVLLT